jgi:hypothetical protein
MDPRFGTSAKTSAGVLLSTDPEKSVVRVAFPTRHFQSSRKAYSVYCTGQGTVGEWKEEALMESFSFLVGRPLTLTLQVVRSPSGRLQ